MSTKLMGASWAVRIDPSAKAVLVSLADQANDDGECWPAVGTIADRTCLSERTVQGALQRLQQAGWLVCEVQGSRRRTNRYLLDVERIYAEQQAAEALKASERALAKTQAQGLARAARAAETAAGTPQQLHPRSSCTPQQLHPHPAAAAPEPKEEPNTNTPIPPLQGAEGLEASDREAPRSKSSPAHVRRAGTLKLAEWLQLCADDGVKPIPADDPVFDYADTVGLSREMVALAWFDFKRKRLASGKGQKDWRATFRNAVRGNWARVWMLTGADGTAALTTVGLQLQRELAADRARHAEGAQA